MKTPLALLLLPLGLALAAACSSARPAPSGPDAASEPIPGDAASDSADGSLSADAGPAAPDASGLADAGADASSFQNPVVVLVTSMGTLEVEMDPANAPISVANYLSYVDKKFYDDTIFHRVIAGFMIQGGGMTADMTPKTPDPPIANEAGNGLSNVRGTIAYARTAVVDSATSQFFINLVDNKFLDHKDDTSGGFGYAVFGKVVSGMDVVDAIGLVQTQTQGLSKDVPVVPVVITSARRKQ